MKNLLLLSCLFVTGLAFSQCGTYQIITSASHNYFTTTPTGGTVSSQYVMVSNNLNVTYQWYKNFSPLTNNTHFSGVSTNHITINNVNYLDDGNLECRVTNIDGCIDTAYFEIDVCDAITQQPVDIVTNLNTTVTFNVNVPYPNATFQWRGDIGAGYHDLTNAGQYSGVNTNTLTVYNVSMSNNNQHFYCEIGTLCNSIQNSDSVVLLINSTNSLSENITSKYKVSPNPVTNSFSINGLENDENITSIQLKDMHGKIVKELVPENMTFDIQDLKSGVYLVEIFTTDSTEIIRIVKQ